MVELCLVLGCFMEGNVNKAYAIGLCAIKYSTFF